MEQLLKGRFFGQTNTTIFLDGITLTDTVYTHDRVDWHYHENAYFTFILQGNVTEGNRKEVYNCGPGSLLFHNWQEPHYNIKPEGFTRGFHVEIEKGWLEGLDIANDVPEGSPKISSPDIKLLMYKIVRACKDADATRDISVSSLVLETLYGLQNGKQDAVLKRPGWACRIEELLRAYLYHTITLDFLSKMLDVHPVHLSRDFPKYFGCNLGEYIRKLRVEKALALIQDKNRTLSAIAYECGFSDQSHFIRCFKEMNGISPSLHRKLLF